MKPLAHLLSLIALILPANARAEDQGPPKRTKEFFIKVAARH